MTVTLSQDNFDRALGSGYTSLRMLLDAARLGGEQVRLEEVNTTKLRTIAWDLEAIGAALHMELNNRLAGPDSMDMA